MSGVEIFGIAAGVVQVADVAAKLSVKVYSFARKVKRARQAIEALAKDITGTGAVMKQLGDVLKADQSLELCQPEALSETKRLMDDCGKVFDEIHDIIDGRHKRNGKGKATLRPGSDSGPSLALTMTVRLAYPFLQEQIEVLKAKLDDKKLEVVIMLNVLILGRQVRSGETSPVVQCQKNFVLQFMSEQQAAKKQLERALAKLDMLAHFQETSTAAASVSSVAMPPGEPHGVLAPGVKSMPTPPVAAVGEGRLQNLPPGLHHRADEVLDHCRLVMRLLEEIRSPQYKVDFDIRHNIQQKILEAHYNEWCEEWNHHDDPIKSRYAYFEQYPQLLKYWKSKDNELSREKGYSLRKGSSPWDPEEVKLHPLKPPSDSDVSQERRPRPPETFGRPAATQLERPENGGRRSSRWLRSPQGRRSMSRSEPISIGLSFSKPKSEVRADDNGSTSQRRRSRSNHSSHEGAVASRAREYVGTIDPRTIGRATSARSGTFHETPYSWQCDYFVADSEQMDGSENDTGAESLRTQFICHMEPDGHRRSALGDDFGDSGESDADSGNLKLLKEYLQQYTTMTDEEFRALG